MAEVFFGLLTSFSFGLLACDKSALPYLQRRTFCSDACNSKALRFTPTFWPNKVKTRGC